MTPYAAFIDSKTQHGADGEHKRGVQAPMFAPSGAA